MIRLVFASLALVISPTLADRTYDYSHDTITPTFTWRGVKNMVGWALNEENVDNKIPSSISTNSYNVATRTAIFERNAFLAYPRSKTYNTPITLAQMKLKGNEYRLHPFPNLEMQERGNCTALQDVIDIFIDTKGFLWVLDAGDPFLWYSREQCQPKIVAFDPAYGTEVSRIHLSEYEEVLEGVPTVSRIIVDYDENDKAIVYVSDVKYRSILVFGKCLQTIPIPESKTVNRHSDVITLNLVSKGSNRAMLIHDELKEKIFFLRLEAVRACSELPEDLMHEIGTSDGTVILGTDRESTVYYYKKSNPAIVYKYDALNKFTKFTCVRKGVNTRVPRHVVPDYYSNGVFLLESETYTTIPEGLITQHRLIPLPLTQHSLVDCLAGNFT